MLRLKALILPHLEDSRVGQPFVARLRHPRTVREPMHTRGRRHPNASVAGLLHRVHAAQSCPDQRPALAIILGNRIADATPELLGGDFEETRCRADRRSTRGSKRLRLCVEAPHALLCPQPKASVLHLVQEVKFLFRFSVFLRRVNQLEVDAVKRFKPAPIRRSRVARDDTEPSVSQLPDDPLDASARRVTDDREFSLRRVEQHRPAEGRDDYLPVEKFEQLL